LEGVSEADHFIRPNANKSHHVLSKAFGG
jgi:hypothetical protein